MALGEEEKGAAEGSCVFMGNAKTVNEDGFTNSLSWISYHSSWDIRHQSIITLLSAILVKENTKNTIVHMHFPNLRPGMTKAAAAPIFPREFLGSG